MRPTFPWVRNMMKYARASFKTKDPGSIIVANTEVLPISMICSWLDVRSAGASEKALRSSYRLGTGNLIWVDPEQKIDHQLISLSLLYMAPITLSRKHSQEEIDLVLQYWNVLRAFGVSKARWYPGFVDTSGVVTTSTSDVFASVHKRDGLLLTLVNTSPDEVRADVSISDFAELDLQDDKTYSVYDPISRSFLESEKQWACGDLATITVNIPAYNPRLLYICESADDPALRFP